MRANFARTTQSGLAVPDYSRDKPSRSSVAVHHSVCIANLTSELPAMMRYEGLRPQSRSPTMPTRPLRFMRSARSIVPPKTCPCA